MFNGLKEISKQYRDKTIVERYKTIVNGIKEEKHPVLIKKQSLS